jgi:hypothetical protein
VSWFAILFMMIKPYLRKPRDGVEHLVRLQRWPGLLRRYAGTYVRIWSNEHEAYWRANASGYCTDGLEAGVYAFEDAWERTKHCDPEKRITFRFANTKFRDAGGQSPALRTDDKPHSL